jgi:deoxyribonuclease (pyrimidine dimer)
MTRINLIDTEDLTDQHLVAEYREIFMIGPALRRSINSKSGLKDKDIPKQYTLNKGHVKFFYNKGTFLVKRYHLLIGEMKRRGMNPDPTRKFNTDFFPGHYMNDWSPTQDEIAINKQRIDKRIREKPKWYRKTEYSKQVL